MTRKTRLTMLILILIVFLFLVYWVWVLLRPQSDPPIVEPEVVTPTQEEIVDTGPSAQELVQQQEQDTRQQASGVTIVAKIFVERYGSYSNEAQFQNLTDVFPLMTDAFVQQTQTFIETSTLPDTYYGVTTRVLTVTVEEMDETKGTAVVLINTQRSIAQGSPQNNEVTYQEIRLSLQQTEGVWKVDTATWL